MNIVEQATKRLEELARAGVEVPWAAAGIANGEIQARVTAGTSGPAHRAPADDATPVSIVRKLESLHAAPPRAPEQAPLSAPEVTPETVPDRPPRRSAMVNIDLEQLERAGYLVPSKARSDLAEEFRHIKRPLLRNVYESGEATVSRAPLIMVTSALPGEGKTFTAVNLAMSLAMEIDTSVLLVDADVVRPSVPKRLGFEANGRGLLDVLQDPAIDLADVMVRTNVPKLSVLPAGSPNARSTELLASASMERLLVELANKYSDRLIIFDAPPLLLTTEARVLASRVGQVLIVIEAARTTRKNAAQAFAAVENCPQVMSVLNRCHAPGELRSYGYYYG
jgi:receptor protein-tyrosine kinase